MTINKQKLIDYIDGMINLYKGDVVLEVVRKNILSGRFDSSSDLHVDLNNRLNQLEMLSADETARKLSLRNAIDELVHEVRNRISEIDRLRASLNKIVDLPQIKIKNEFDMVARMAEMRDIAQEALSTEPTGAERVREMYRDYANRQSNGDTYTCGYNIGARNAIMLVAKELGINLHINSKEE